MSAIRNNDECRHKQMFYIPPINQSMDTFTAGRELLSLSYIMGGIEKSCLRHKCSFPIALTASEIAAYLTVFRCSKIAANLINFTAAKLPLT